MPPTGDALIREFAGNRTLLAVRVSSTDLGGLFVKRLTVPSNAAALVFHSNGEVSLLSAGQEISGRFDAVLAKTGEIHISLEFPRLRSRDQTPIDGRVSFAVLIDTRTLPPFKAFARFSGGHYRLQDLETFLAERTRAALARIAGERPVAELHRKDLLPELEAAVIDRLGPHLMGTGLVFDRALSGGFVSNEFERLQDQASAADLRAQERRRRLQEVATFLEKEESVQKLLAEIDDPRLKLIVYRELIEGGGGGGGSGDRATDAWLRLDEAALAKIHAIMQKTLAGPSFDLHELLSETAERAYAALGSKIVEIDPQNPSAWKEYDVAEAVRSVRPTSLSGRDLLLVGGRRTCILLDPAPGGERLAFPLPGNPSPRGGINAVDSYGTTLYATHSEYGLALWDLDRPGRPGELVYQSLTSGQKTTRAVRVVQNRLLFATGPSVFLIDLEVPSAEPRRFASSHGAVTSMALTPRTLFASTEEGAILSWELERPDYPELLVRKTGAITALRLVRSARGIVHLLYALNDTSIHARVIGQTLETEYEAPGHTFTTFDATSDLVAGAAHRSRLLFLWRSDNPRRPEHTLDLSKVSPHEIMDVALRRRLVLK